MEREIGMTVYHLVFFRFKSSVLTCFGSPQPSSFFHVQGRRDGGTGVGGFWPSTILSANNKTAELLKQVFDKVEKI